MREGWLRILHYSCKDQSQAFLSIKGRPSTQTMGILRSNSDLSSRLVWLGLWIHFQEKPLNF